MKWFLAFALLSVTTAQALPLRVQMGEDTFMPQAEVDIQRNLRTLSTPPFTVRMQAPDIVAFAQFTAAHTGMEMQVFVCDEVVFSPVLSAPISDGEIYIHTAMANGRLEAFSTQGCP